MIKMYGYEAYNLTETYHLSVERAERIRLISDNIGLGSEIISYIGYNDNDEKRLYILTDTGVMIVKAIDADVAITAFVPTITQAKAFFEVAQQKMPKWFIKVVVRNKAWYDRNVV